MFRFIAKYDRYLEFKLDDVTRISMLDDNVNVIILRSMSFFYVEQKTTLGALKKQYTDTAIAAFENDGFIKIKQTW